MVIRHARWNAPGRVRLAGRTLSRCTPLVCIPLCPHMSTKTCGLALRVAYLKGAMELGCVDILMSGHLRLLPCPHLQGLHGHIDRASMRNRHRLTRFTPSNSTVSSTNVELENGSRCQKVLTGDNVLLLGCQKFCHGGEPWLPQRHDTLGQNEGRPFQGETRETKTNRRHPGRCQGCFRELAPPEECQCSQRYPGVAHCS